MIYRWSEIERERKREGERERGNEREKKERIVILKGMTVALAPFSYLVTTTALAGREWLEKLQLR